MPRPVIPEIPMRPSQAAVAAVKAAPDREEMPIPVPAVPKRPTRVHVVAGAPMKAARPGRESETVFAASAGAAGSFGWSGGWYHPQARFLWGSTVNAPDLIMAVWASFHACSSSSKREQALTAASLNPSTRFSYFSFAFWKLTSA